LLYYSLTQISSFKISLKPKYFMEQIRTEIYIEDKIFSVKIKKPGKINLY